MNAHSLFRHVVPALAVCLACAGIAGAGVAISPAYVEVELDKGKPSGKFEISNLSDTEERYRVRALAFEFGPDGGLHEVKDQARSMASWIIFNPKELTVPPKSKQVVRFVITPRGKLIDGEYWAAMELESLRTTTAKGADAGGRTLNIEVIPTILVPIFGSYGKVNYAGSLKALDAATSDKGTVAGATFVNTGNGRLFISGAWELLGADGKPAASGGMGAFYLMPGADRLLTRTLEAQVPAGQYTLRTKFTSPQIKQEMVAEKVVQFRPPPATQPFVRPPTTQPAGETTATTQPAGRSTPTTGPAPAGSPTVEPTAAPKGPVAAKPTTQPAA